MRSPPGGARCDADPAGDQFAPAKAPAPFVGPCQGSYDDGLSEPEAELLPLFPLHTVLFPGALVPLHVFEERYRMLVRERRDFGVVLIREGWEVGQTQDLHPVGTVATLTEIEDLPDGRFFVLARGLNRFRVQSLDLSRPYLQARVEALVDPPGRASPRLLGLLERYLAAHGLEVTPQLMAGRRQSAVWLVGSVLQTDPARQQRLLEAADPALAEELLAEELAWLERLGRLGAMAPRRPSPN